MKSIGRFLPNRMSSLVRGFLPILGSSRIARNFGCDLLSRRDISTKFCHITFLKCCICLILIKFVSKSGLVKVCSRLLFAPDDLCVDDFDDSILHILMGNNFVHHNEVDFWYGIYLYYFYFF